MKIYDNIFFDLDGTLTNPEHGLIASFEYALKKMGVSYGKREELKRYIGPPLYDEWRSVYGFDEEEATRALLLFREYFAVYGWWDNLLYDGVRKMLSELKMAGKRIFLSTSKPEIFATKILNLFDISRFFDFIGGASTDKTRDKKHEVLEYVLDAIGEPERSTCILVGDRKYDAEGARMVGIDSLGVLYGHGDEQEIFSAGFTAVAKSVEDITAFLLQG